LAETKKNQQETKSKGGWFKQPTKEVPKEAPKIEFKGSPLVFTNSALSN
jgi:hypothetical protein